MLVKKGIKLGNIDYYIEFECIYKKEAGITKLYLKDYDDECYDGGNLSILIRTLEEKYSDEYIKKYNSDICFLADAIYIYENIPFINGVGDYYIVSRENKIDSITYISREELNNYISENKINIKDNPKFKLSNKNTWLI